MDVSAKLDQEQGWKVLVKEASSVFLFPCPAMALLALVFTPYNQLYWVYSMEKVEKVIGNFLVLRVRVSL